MAKKRGNEYVKCIKCNGRGFIKGNPTCPGCIGLGLNLVPREDRKKDRKAEERG